MHCSAGFVSVNEVENRDWDEGLGIGELARAYSLSAT